MICLVDLPQPVHGMANINQSMISELKKSGCDLNVINTVPSYGSFLFPGKMWVILKGLHTLFCYVRFFIFSIFNIRGQVYRSINGGFGQVYDLIYLLFTRIFFNKTYIHHHSFAYINKYKLLFRVLIFFAGKKAVHIVLGEKMKNELCSLYGINKDSVRIISNLAFFDYPETELNDEVEGPIRLGYLANVSIEKGIESFVSTCCEMKKAGIDFEAKIAGPFSDEKSKMIVSSALNQNDKIEYMGALYGDDKIQFYRNIDCFVFPSKNEAEPLVLYEAASCGVFLIGTRYGCMEGIIRSLLGVSIEDDESIGRIIAERIEENKRNLFFDIKERQRRVKLFIEGRQKSVGQLNSFTKELGVK